MKDSTHLIPCQGISPQAQFARRELTRMAQCGTFTRIYYDAKDPLHAATMAKWNSSFAACFGREVKPWAPETFLSL